MSEGQKKLRNWLEGLELPGFDRQLDIIGAFPAEKIGSEGVKRTVRLFNPASKIKLPCFVCGRHRAITQSHHLIEVAKVAKVLRAMAIYDWAPNIPMVSLCPNHHAYWHGHKRLGQTLPLELGREISEAEWDRLIEVEDLRGKAHDQVWREVRDEFLKREAVYRREQSEIDEGQGDG